MIRKEEVLSALRNVIDPDFGRDIVSLGFVKDVTIQDDVVSLRLELTTPACPVRESFREQCEKLVSAIPGVARVNVTLSAQPRQRSANLPTHTLNGIKNIVAVSSCKGGVGKSTVAAFLSRAVQRQGYSVALLDTDIYGPSLPTLLRVTRPRVVVRNNLLQPVDVDGLATMSLGYLMGDRPAVMRGPMVSNYTLQMLFQTDWGERDYLFLDLPPGTGDIQLTLVQQASLDGAVIVTTPQSLSLVDVARGIVMFEKVNVPVLGIVENMAYFECDGCGKRHYLFGSSAAALQERFGVETLASFPILGGVSDASSREAGADNPLWEALADRVHRRLGMQKIMGEQKPRVEARDGALYIHWPDQQESVIPNKRLRASCQCALCVNEFTGQPLLNPETIPDDISVEAIQPLGNYAVSITWSDGHSSGIYSWEHLRRLTGLPPKFATTAS
jgi:Mrp family chromosome partitioning ATPase/DUF971 family protein